MPGGVPAVFFGTPRFSVPSLRALHEIAEVRLVVSRPDRASGRGRKVRPTPVKAAAKELGLPVYQPDSLKPPEASARLEEAGAHFFFTIAYGKIIPEHVLHIPPKGCLNMHASLLPKYRGSAPVQWAVINGERETGLTLMLMDAGMDTGPMLETTRIEILPGETAGELEERMSGLAARLVREAIPRYLEGKIRPAPQDDAEATYAPMLKKEDGLVDWHEPAARVVSRVLGTSPWPGAYTYAAGRRIKILGAEERGEPSGPLAASPPGSIFCEDDRLLVRCGEGAVEITELQAEGKKAMGASSFLCGCELPEQFDPGAGTS